MTNPTKLAAQMAKNIILTCAIALLATGCASTDRERLWVGVPYVIGWRYSFYPESAEVDRIFVIVPIYWKDEQ